MSLPPVLLLGVESTIGLAIMRELGRHGVPVFGIGRTDRAFGRASRYCTRFLVRGVGPIATWLPDMAGASGARALIAFSERDLIDLAQLPPRLGDCEVLTPRADRLGRVLDKATTIALARSVGIEVPIDHQGVPDRWPVVLKWPDPPAVADRLAAASLPLLKTEFCRDPAELERALGRYRPTGLRPLVQSYAPGRGIAQMVYRDRGRTTLYFQHEQLHEWPPEGGIASLVRSVSPDRHAALRTKTEALMDALGWDGPAMAEYRWDPATDRAVFMEVNGRFWGSQPLASAAGAEFAWELYRRRVLGETSPAPEPKAGVMARMIVPEAKRLGRLFFQRGQVPDPCFRATPWRDLAGLASGYLNPRMHYYVHQWRDPMPLLADVAAMVRGKLAPTPPRDPARDSRPSASPSAG